MNNHRQLGDALVLLALCLLLLACGAQRIDGLAIAGGQVVDMGSYQVKMPPGEGWNIRRDKKFKGMVEFKKRSSEYRATVISVLPGRLGPGTENQPEEGIASMIFDEEERNLKERGATRSYILTDLSKGITKVGGKTLHVMNYTIMDSSRSVPVEIKYAMYVYLPPDVTQNKVFYGFLIGESQEIGGPVFAIHSTKINPVIDSLKWKVFPSYR